VEAVVDPLAGGTYFAYALRRPADKLLWLHPYATEGTEANNTKLNIPILPLIFLIGAGGLGAFTFFYFVVMAFSKNNFSLLLMAAMGLVFLLPGYLAFSALKNQIPVLLLLIRFLRLWGIVILKRLILKKNIMFLSTNYSIYINNIVKITMDI
jgi:hypothetical protein